MEKKVNVRILQKIDTKANWDKAVNFVPKKGELIVYSDTNRIKVGDGAKKVSELPFLADSDTHQHIKSLKTDNTEAQSPSSGEAIAGEGTINLHKVSKTGSYNDLRNKPDLNTYLPKAGGVLSGVIRGGAIDVHPENHGTLISYYTNDLAFLTQRGGSYIITNTTSNTVIASSATNNIAANMFDGSPSYYNFSLAAKTDVVVIIIKSPVKYSYFTAAGIGFGSAIWRAGNVKIEMGYSATNKGTAQSPDADIKWVTRINLTNQGNGLVYGDSSGPYASDGGTTAGTWSYIRITLTNFNSTGPRIAQIFTVNYGSKGMHNTFLGLGGGNVYGNLDAKGLSINGKAVREFIYEEL